MTKQDLSQVLLLSLCSISFALWEALKLQPGPEQLVTANLPLELHMKENMEDLPKAEMLTARRVMISRALAVLCPYGSRMKQLFLFSNCLEIELKEEK